jgi:hypothetical protein
MNYTKSLGEGKHRIIKPNVELVFVQAPRILSDELYNTGLKILEDMSKIEPFLCDQVYIYSLVSLNVNVELKCK